jgi:hypothetical protein
MRFQVLGLPDELYAIDLTKHRRFRLHDARRADKRCIRTFSGFKTRMTGGRRFT